MAGVHQVWNAVARLAMNMPERGKDPLPRLELLVYLLVGAVTVVGIVLSFADYPSFLALIREDGIVEWLTVSGLLIAMAVCFRRAARLFRHKTWMFLAMTLLLGLACLFGAGEEISWGQRLFGFDSPKWFATQNVQSETNLHNLLIGDVDFTKAVFGRGLAVLLAMYFLVLTPLYAFKQPFAAWLDRLGLPVPRTRQVLVFAVIAALLNIPDIPGRESELFEMAAVFLFLVILVNPRNRGVFKGTGSKPNGSPD